MVPYFIQMSGDKKATQSDPEHQNRNKKANLMVQKAIECLESEDDCQIEYHSCQSGREDGVGQGLA